MKLIIAGSRSITNIDAVIAALYASPFRCDDITEVVSGGAPGVDTCGERLSYLCEIPVKQFLAKWRELGRGAGYARNREMAAYADALLAVWDGHSRGTSHMVDCMMALKKPVYLHTFEGGLI